MQKCDVEKFGKDFVFFAWNILKDIYNEQQKINSNEKRENIVRKMMQICKGGKM